VKVRNGFVSNSSSSSFVVSGPGKMILKNALVGTTYVIGAKGKREFGWEEDKTSDFDSKVNWAALQAMYATDDYLLEMRMYMLENVIKEHTGAVHVDIVLQKDKYDEPGYGCIDHQSTSRENEYFLEIFESEQELKEFLFCPKNYVQGGNDN